MTQKIKSNPARTVLTISTGFLILYFCTKSEWAIIVSLVIGLIGVCSNYLSEKIEWGWMKIAWGLSLIVPKIMLTLVFFLLLCPIAHLSKLFRKTDLLQLKNKNQSTFKNCNKVFDKSSFEKTW